MLPDGCCDNTLQYSVIFPACSFAGFSKKELVDLLLDTYVDLLLLNAKGPLEGITWNYIAKQVANTAGQLDNIILAYYLLPGVTLRNFSI